MKETVDFHTHNFLDELASWAITVMVEKLWGHFCPLGRHLDVASFRLGR